MAEVKNIKPLGPTATAGAGADKASAAVVDSASEASAGGVAADTAAQASRVVQQKSIVRRVAAANPQVATFVKDQPTLAYKIISNKFEDIPAGIREHLGSIDSTKYTREYLEKNRGSVIALQMKDGQPDFYIISKDAYNAKYTSVDIADVAKKNAKYFNSLNVVVPGIANNSGVVAVRKKVSTNMIKMSDIGYKIDEPVTIKSTWGEQTKPAGQDAYLAWDGSKNQYYMINTGTDGNPLSYVPLK